MVRATSARRPVNRWAKGRRARACGFSGRRAWGRRGLRIAGRWSGSWGRRQAEAWSDRGVYRVAEGGGHVDTAEHEAVVQRARKRRNFREANRRAGGAGDDDLLALGCAFGAVRVVRRVGGLVVEEVVGGVAASRGDRVARAGDDGPRLGVVLHVRQIDRLEQLAV